MHIINTSEDPLQNPVIRDLRIVVNVLGDKSPQNDPTCTLLEPLVAPLHAQSEDDSLIPYLSFSGIRFMNTKTIRKITFHLLPQNHSEWLKKQSSGELYGPIPW